VTAAARTTRPISHRCIDNLQFITHESDKRNAVKKALTSVSRKIRVFLKPSLSEYKKD
jgi:hypothetical protein